MDESNGRGSRRYMILIVVVALHLALLAALVMTSRTTLRRGSAEHSVELLFLPPANFPKVRSDLMPPRRLSGSTAITVAPPVLDSSSPLGSQSAGSSADGNGSGVDWAAEARRALQAFEIRNHQPPANYSISSRSADESWWPQGPHRSGDRFKTSNGDWIVWINANCYQVAGSASNTQSLGASPPQTVCEPAPAAPPATIR
jgi:hypothetical protein